MRQEIFRYFVNGIAKVLNALLNLLILRKLAHSLNSENLSLHYLIGIYAQIGQIFFLTPVGSYINNNISHRKNSINYVFDRIVTIYFFVSLALAYCISTAKFNTYTSSSIIFLSLFIVIFIPVSNFYFGIYGLVHYQKYYYNSIILLAPTLLLYIAVNVLTINEFYYWSICQLFTTIIIVLILRINTRKIWKQKYKFNWSKIVTFGVPLIITLIITWYINNKFKISISENTNVKYFSEFLLGYGVAASIIGLIESVYLQAFYPKFIIRTENNNKINVNYFKFIITYLILLFIVYFFVLKTFDNFIINQLINISSETIMIGFNSGCLFEVQRSIFSLHNFYYQRKNDNIYFLLLNLVILIIVYFTSNFIPEYVFNATMYSYAVLNILVIFKIVYLIIRNVK